MKYFIIVDMQVDFVSGALKNEAAKAIVPGIVEKARQLKQKGYKIIATRDTHQVNYMDTQEGRNLPVPHCIQGTEGWQVVSEIMSLVDEFVDKPSFGFHDWKLSDVEAIDMCGTCTAICVASNFSVLKAAYPEVPITVYSNLCACLTPSTHHSAITVMKTQQAIIVDTL